jgi:hypothetical protein
MISRRDSSGASKRSAGTLVDRLMRCELIDVEVPEH